MKTPVVFFNASVILAGLNSPKGGSAKVLNLSAKGKIKGFVSEIVVLEAKRHAKKIGLTPDSLEKKLKTKVKVITAPNKLATKYNKLVKDAGDLHLFTSTEAIKSDYLVSLDKKHVLSLSPKIKTFKILSPGEMIRELS